MVHGGKYSEREAKDREAVSRDANVARLQRAFVRWEPDEERGYFVITG